MRRTHQKLLVVTALCVSSACSNGTEPRDRPTATFLAFRSEAGDWIGQGLTRRYGLADGTWSARALPYPSLSTYLDISLEPLPGRGTPSWRLRLSAPNGQTIAPGVYEDARDWPGYEHPSLEFWGEGRGCNGIVGRFVVHELKVAPDSSIERLHAEFEQYCDYTPPLHGEIAIVANPWR